tara:strand:+ start:914 stop:1078 length:165 start_codon:yes stop_codon:yes gene_type:complete
MTKLDLVTGIIAAEEGNLNDEELVAFVSDHQDSLSQLQGRWQRLVADLKESNKL